ncbi:NAD-dependent epimerase/dehydratase family protein [Jatrophihabitans sp. YIM 134969]
MRIVVIGGSGNLGTALLRRLADDPAVDVVGVSRRRPPPTPPYDVATAWEQLDLATDDCRPALRRVVDGADVVVNLAWGFQPTRRPELLEQTGVGGTRRVLETLLEAEVPRLVQTSSVGAYAPRRDLEPVDESYPTTGVPSSLYSRHKAAAERLFDRTEAEHGDTLRIVRIRPGFVLQREAGASLGRYGLPPWLPRQVLGHLPLVPLPTGLVLPVVHSDDVAAGLHAAAVSDVHGAFNFVADPPLVADDVARALGGRSVTVPQRLLRPAVDLSWRARVQPIDAGWYDLALQVPMMSSARARRELGWLPTVDPAAAFDEAISGISRGLGVGGAVLGPRRTPADILRSLAVGGTVSRRRLS